MLKVTDQGTGIPKKILNRIFEPFFTTKGVGRGTGLGLSTAYGIVKNHGGDIHVVSEIDRGATFHIYLPALTECSALPAADTATEKVAGQGTVLLVDDELAVLESVSKLLAISGFEVLAAPTGDMALTLFEENRESVDLVVLDLVMPRLSGRELFYKIRQIDPQVKVLLSSGCGMAGQAEELLDAGCCAFIQKPYDIDQLSTKVMEILSGE